MSTDKRTWVYVLSEPIDGQIADTVKAELKKFTASWSSHGRTVSSEVSIVHRRIILLSAEVEHGTISGCGIDASVNVLEEIVDGLGLKIAPPLSVCYLDHEGSAQVVGRSEFVGLFEQGDVTPETLCVQADVRHIAGASQVNYLLPLGSSWHSRLVGVDATT